MAYLTITRICGDPDELLAGYRKSSVTMTAVGRDHGLWRLRWRPAAVKGTNRVGDPCRALFAMLTTARRTTRLRPRRPALEVSSRCRHLGFVWRASPFAHPT
jgi:hypothetical protein